MDCWWRRDSNKPELCDNLTLSHPTLAQTPREIGEMRDSLICPNLLFGI
jgi:hypothetical protein